jgi:cytoskeletal protein CcmA (bactofilin family)
VLGQLRGAVHALKRVEILAGGSLNGDVETSELVIASGSSFNGSCKMPELKPADRKRAAKPERVRLAASVKVESQETPVQAPEPIKTPTEPEPKRFEHRTPLMP